jgi:hypothetical protein
VSSGNQNGTTIGFNYKSRKDRPKEFFDFGVIEKVIAGCTARIIHDFCSALKAFATALQ